MSRPGSPPIVQRYERGFRRGIDAGVEIVGLVIAAREELVVAQGYDAAGGDIPPMMLFGNDAAGSHEARGRIGGNAIFPAVTLPEILRRCEGKRRRVGREGAIVAAQVALAIGTLLLDH